MALSDGIVDILVMVGANKNLPHLPAFLKRCREINMMQFPNIGAAGGFESNDLPVRPRFRTFGEKNDIVLASDQTARLIALPEDALLELYGHILVQEEAIEVYAHGFERHSFLSAFQQGHSLNALQVYYYQNSFRLNVRDYNCSAVVKFIDMLEKLGLKSSLVRKQIHAFRSDTVPNWKNLLEWLRQHYKASLGEWEIQAGKGMRKTIICSMFVTVQQLRDVLPWDKIEPILLAQRQILVNTDDRWAEDEESDEESDVECERTSAEEEVTDQA